MYEPLTKVLPTFTPSILIDVSLLYNLSTAVLTSLIAAIIGVKSIPELILESIFSPSFESPPPTPIEAKAGATAPNAINPAMVGKANKPLIDIAASPADIPNNAGPNNSNCGKEDPNLTIISPKLVIMEEIPDATEVTIFEIDVPKASTVGAIKDIALPIPIKARVKTAIPNITLGLLKALPIDLKPAPMPVKADCIALPFTNCNNNNAGIAAVSYTHLTLPTNREV